MPHYTFRCEVCGEVFERYLSFSESLQGITCPQGHTQVVRVYRPPAIVFKGSGFYITDHGRNGSNRSNGSNGHHGTASKKTQAESTQANKTQAAKTETPA